MIILDNPSLQTIRDCIGIEYRATQQLTITCSYSTAYLAPLPERPSNALSGGAIAGAVIGFIALLALFGLVVFLVFRPPERLQPFLRPRPADGETPVDAHSRSFDNPISFKDISANENAE